MFAWPWLERRITGDVRRHDLLDRPRDRPIRTAIGAAFLSWVVIIFAIGSTDRLFFRMGIDYKAQIHFWRIGVWVRRSSSSSSSGASAGRLQRSGAHPLRAWQGAVVRRGPDGSVEIVEADADRPTARPSEAPVGTAPGERGGDR